MLVMVNDSFIPLSDVLNIRKLNYRIKTFNDDMVNNTNKKLVFSEEWL